MQTAKKITIITLILSFIFLPLSIYSYSIEESRTEDLKNGFLRLHIRANSDTDKDQELKLTVRNEVLKYTTDILSDISSKQEAKDVILQNLEYIKDIACKTIKNNGFSYTVNVFIDNEYFDRREYDGFFLPEGYYDSLIIEIGSGLGRNWWCVLFPAVCLSGASENTDVKVDTSDVPEEFLLADKPAQDDVQFEFWIVNAFKSLFE